MWKLRGSASQTSSSSLNQISAHSSQPNKTKPELHHPGVTLQIKRKAKSCPETRSPEARVPQKGWGQRTGAPRGLEAAGGRAEKGTDGWTMRGVPAQPAGRTGSQFSSVAQSGLTLCDPMDCSTPDLPVHHQLLELTQTHVHRVSDAIQPSHPLSFPSPPAFSLSQHQGLFQ